MANNDEKNLEKTGVPVTRRSIAQAEKKAVKKAEQTQAQASRTKRSTTAKATNTEAVQPAKRSDVQKTGGKPVEKSTATKQGIASAPKQTDQEKTKEVPKRGDASQSDVKARVNKMDKKQKKGERKKPGKPATAGRSFMVALMAIYFIVVGIVGVWGVSQFFWFYIQEKSPVMAAGTENSRVENTPEIEASKIAAAEEKIKGDGLALKNVTIHQVGPTIHFLIVGNDEIDVETARVIGQHSIRAFAESIGQPDMFTKYEAQIIVTKDILEELGDDVMLRPAAEEGPEQAFPQYGVSNKNLNRTENEGEILYNISWSRNW